MKLLAIETATEACSAALSVDGDVLGRYEFAKQRHTELILPMCNELLEEAGVTLSQLDAVAFGRGPGSFTGVRIATGVIQGIAFAKDLPVVAVSTLAVLAQEAIETEKKTNILAAIDARMKEVYWGVYVRDESGLAHLLEEERVIKPQIIAVPSSTQWYGVGSGWKAYSDTLVRRLGACLEGYDGELLPNARFLIPLALAAYSRGEIVSAEQALPVYLRDNVAKTNSSL
jgi:tRNA threonylcarbamoyladenosine biosynthesis protein TsaB